ncbi:hypothetical protein ASD8599_03970 [Ascidiaceihabitans donghaensis]|uniref:Uncharacterized protein n=1 Tax=Ascidiaceihabitans donghaensis TaxID=1510460 RepID=A0A2R8BPG5_9RHOB|nr:hypothetical protein [Ascidiaceihabitans donghaensis]SPH27504.1 hypothetical protein ASD8599_03970 [Ascidiaceihabitans donghaensis]
MPHAPIAMSSNFQLVDLSYKKNGTLTPQSCVDLSAKIRNIESQIKSLEDITQAQKSNNALQMRLNKGLLVATIIRDTCVGFLDMAAALAPTEQQQKFAGIGSTLITSTQTMGEYYTGDANMGDVALKAASEFSNYKSSSTPIGIASNHVAQTHIGAAGVANTAFKGDKAATQKAGLKYAVDVSFDNAILITDMTKNQPVMGKVGAGMRVAKAASSYGFALDTAQDNYWSEHDRLQSSAFATEHNYIMGMRRLQTDLSNAVASFEECQQYM